METMATEPIPPSLRASWQVPSFDLPLWAGRTQPWCVVIPVINEGERLANLLRRMAQHGISRIADILIVDGGSRDGSTEVNRLQALEVRSSMALRRILS